MESTTDTRARVPFNDSLWVARSRRTPQRQGAPSSSSPLPSTFLLATNLIIIIIIEPLPLSLLMMEDFIDDDDVLTPRLRVYVRKCTVRFPRRRRTRHGGRTVRWPGMATVLSSRHIVNVDVADQLVWFFPFCMEQLLNIATIELLPYDGDARFPGKIQMPAAKLLPYRTMSVVRVSGGNGVIRRAYQMAEDDETQRKLLSDRMLQRWRTENEEGGGDAADEVRDFDDDDDDDDDDPIDGEDNDNDDEDISNGPENAVTSVNEPMVDTDDLPLAQVIQKATVTVQKTRKDRSSALSQMWDEHKLDKTIVAAAMKKALKSSKMPSGKDIPLQVAQFFLFIYERQCAWKKRKIGTPILVIQDADKPGVRTKVYSNIPVFQQFFFCNNHRDLDYGTRYFRTQMMARPRPTTAATTTSQINWMETILFASFVYRQVNRVDTFTAFGCIPTTRLWPKFQTWATGLVRQRGQPFFTGAHQTCSLPNLIWYVNHLLQDKCKNLKSVAMQLVDASTTSQESGLKACYGIIKSQLIGCGPFFTWQILCDLLECKCLAGGCDANQWTMLGPGAENGMDAMFKGKPKASTTSMTKLQLAKELTKMQAHVFETIFKVDFCKFRDDYLSLKDMEHALCEFSKFLKLNTALSQKKPCGGRKWKPRSNVEERKCSGCARNGKKVTSCDTCLNSYCSSCDTAKSPSKCDLTWICLKCQEFESYRH